LDFVFALLIFFLHDAVCLIFRFFCPELKMEHFAQAVAQQRNVVFEGASHERAQHDLFTNMFKRAREYKGVDSEICTSCPLSANRLFRSATKATSSSVVLFEEVLTEYTLAHQSALPWFPRNKIKMLFVYRPELLKHELFAQLISEWREAREEELAILVVSVNANANAGRSYAQSTEELWTVLNNPVVFSTLVSFLSFVSSVFFCLTEKTFC